MPSDCQVLHCATRCCWYCYALEINKHLDACQVGWLSFYYFYYQVTTGMKNGILNINQLWPSYNMNDIVDNIYILSFLLHLGSLQIQLVSVFIMRHTKHTFDTHLAQDCQKNIFGCRAALNINPHPPIFPPSNWWIYRDKIIGQLCKPLKTGPFSMNLCVKLKVNLYCGHYCSKGTRELNASCTFCMSAWSKSS